MKKPVIDRNRPLGLYLHIPFCKAKCAYCDFYSLPHSEEKMDAYAAALARHITEVAPQMQNHRVDTVYFGGGTPSYLGHKRLIALLKTVKSSAGSGTGRRSPWRPTPTAPGTGGLCGPCAGRASTASPWGCSPRTMRSCAAWAGSTPGSR